MATRGGTEPAEERDAIATVRRFIELHGTSRFEGMGDLAPRDGSGFAIDQRIVNRVGFRRRRDDGAIEYLILPEVWRSEVCAGFDPTMVAKTLATRGMLVSGSGGKIQNYQRLPGFANPVRCYVISGGIFGDARRPQVRAESDFG